MLISILIHGYLCTFWFSMDLQDGGAGGGGGGVLGGD